MRDRFRTAPCALGSQKLASSPAAFLSVLLGLFLAATCGQAAFEVSFVGPKSIHVRAWHTAAADEVRYEEVMEDPTGAEHVLLDGPSAGKTVRVACGPSEGDYTIRVTVETVDEEGIHHVTESESTITVSAGVQGTMFFDENLDSPEGDIEVGSVQIPSGRTLTLTGRWRAGSFSATGGRVSLDQGYFDGNHFSAGNSGTVSVVRGAEVAGGSLITGNQGLVEVEDGALVSGVSFMIYPGGLLLPGDASGFSGNQYHYFEPGLSGYSVLKSPTGILILNPGAEGATVKGEGYDVTVRATPVSFSLSGCTVRIEAPADIVGGIDDSAVVVGQAVIPSRFTAEVNLSGLTLSSLALWGAENCSVTDCEVGGGTTVCMGKPQLSGNVFLGGVVIAGGTGAELKDNALHGTLVFSGWDATLDRPTIENNDLLAPQAVLYRSSVFFEGEPSLGAIVIGPSYYGSAVGPALEYGGGFLGQGSGHQGGWVSIEDLGSPRNRTEYFTLAPPLKRRATGHDPRHYAAHYWVAGWASGQGILDWSGGSRWNSLFKNIPTLLSFDVKSSGRLTSTPPLYVKLGDSTILQPESAPSALSRDLNDFSKTRVRIGGTTVNFRLPETTAATLDFRLCLRNPAGSEVVLTEGTLKFEEHPWKRPLRIAVIPIGVEYNFSTTPPPGAAPMSRHLKYVLPSMFPIPHGMLQIDIKSPEWMETYVGLFSNLPGIAALAAKLSLWYVDALAQTKYDLVVAVMPPNSIRLLSAEIDYFLNLTQPASGVNYGYGENFWLSTPRVCFVDASQPMAVLHEMGHAAGLYRDTEQYDMLEYKATEGMPLRGFSSAALDPGLGNVINGFPPSGILHFAETNMTWYGKEYSWIDIMGLPETEIWPSTGTHGSIMSFFTGLLSEPAGASSSAAILTDFEASGASLRPASGELSHRNIRPMDITGPAVTLAGVVAAPVGQNPEFLSAHTTAVETSLLLRPAPELEPASNWYQYGIVRFYDAAGAVLAENDFDLPLVANQSTWWTGSLPLPSGCVRYSLFGHRGGNDQLKTTWSKAGNLSVQIDRTLLPATVGETLALAWKIEADDLQADSRLVSQVYISTNNGATWDHLGKATEQTYLSLPTDGLPETDALAIRVVASDGFISTRDTVAGLAIGDRPPVLKIAEPRNGDVALVGAEWLLQARAFDLEDGDLSVTWLSSRDGLLGSSAVLSTGVHQLTCSATDTAGHRVEQALEVTVVLAASSTDLSIGSLTLLGLNHELRKNWNMASGGLRPGETNVLDCVIRNSGRLTTGVVTMRIEQPDGTVRSLPSVTAEFAPLAWHRITIPFVPALYGTYTLTISVEALDLADRTPEDNVAALRSFTHAPSLLVFSSGTRKEFVLLSTRYDFPEPSPGEPVIPITVIETLDLYNGGYVPLVISNASLTCGPDFYGADHFRIYPSVSFPVTLPPASSLHLEVQFYGKTLEPEVTGLRVQSNDPRRPNFEIPVHGWIHPADEQTWRDQDGDGLPSFLETRIGLNPSLADSDGDGVFDGQEDRNANGVRDPYETGALDPDSDDDGLLDGEEDLNGNGGHDGQETSALLPDSDGDGISDADEARCRTRGLHAGDYLRLWGPATAGSELNLEWEGRAGVPYRVEISPDLEHWQVAPSGVDQDQQAQPNPKVNGPLRYRGPVLPGSAFYRVGVTAP